MPAGKVFLSAIAGVLLLAACPSFGQQTLVPSVESAVLKAQDDLVQAEIRGDRDALNRIFTDGFTHTHSTGMVQGKAGYVKLFDTGSIYKSFGFSHVVVQVLNPSTAVVTGNVVITTIKSSNEDAFLEVFVLQDKAWRCAAWVTTPIQERAPAPHTQ
jgi:hypothetical protein